MSPVRASLIALACLGFVLPSAARAGVVNGNEALMLSALVGIRSPAVSAPNRARLTRLMDGVVAAGPAFNVIAAHVNCRSSTVDIAANSCELTFGTRTVRLHGRLAHELGATMIAAGLSAEGAAGSSFLTADDLRCRVEPTLIAGHGGDGAECRWR